MTEIPLVKQHLSDQFGHFVGTARWQSDSTASLMNVYALPHHRLAKKVLAMALP